jgi:hypothetical protein
MISFRSLMVLSVSIGCLAALLAAAPPFGRAAAAEPPTAAASDASDDPLPERARARLGSLRFREVEPLSEVVFSPEGTQLATRGYYSTVRLWDAVTGQGRPPLLKGGVSSSLVVSKGGNRLAASCKAANGEE